MKSYINHLTGTILLLIASAFVALASETPRLTIHPQPEAKAGADRVQSSSKPVVFFNNMLDNADYFNNAYWRFVDGTVTGSDEIYKDSCVQMPFDNAHLASLNINDHLIYVFPLGDYPLYVATPEGGTKVIDFIRMALDSGKRVIIFSHNALRTSSNDQGTKEFIDTTLNIDYLGLKPLVKDGTRYGYFVKGLQGDEIGLNQMRWFNCGVGGSDEKPVDYDWDDVETFRSKDTSVCPVFDFIATSEDQAKAVFTDSAVGLRRIMNNKARVVFFSYDLVNMSRTGDIELLLHAAIGWCFKNNPDLGSKYRVPSEFYDYGYVKVGKKKTKPVYIMNDESAVEELVINNMEFDYSEHKDVIYPVDEEGNNIEAKLKDSVITIPIGGFTKLEVAFECDGEGNAMRNLSLHTNEPAEDGSNSGQNHSITFSGTCGEEEIEEPYLSYDRDEVNFKPTMVAETTEMLLTVSNLGNQPLNIIAMKFGNTSSNASFSIPKDQMKAQTIPGDSSITLNVKFSPKTISTMIVDTFFIYTEAGTKNGTKFPIAMIGSSTPGSVPEIVTRQGRFSMSIAPNPVSGSAILKYNWNSSVPSGLVLKLADNLGNIVSTLFDGTVEGGESNVPIDVSRLAQGSYSIIAEIHGEMARLPLVIVR